MDAGLTTTTTTAAPQSKSRTYRITPRELDTYQACAFKFAADRRGKQQKVWQPQPSSFPLALGNAVHDALNQANRQAMKRGSLPSADEVFDRFWNRSRFGSTEQEVEAAYLARPMVEQYLTYVTDNDLEILASEQFILTPEMHIGEGIYLIISGKLDVLFRRPGGALMYQDHKTGSQLPTPDILEYALSSAAYRGLVRRLQPRAETILISQRLLSTGAEVTVDLSDDVVQAAKQQMADLVRAMDADPAMISAAFQPSENEQCAWCPHQSVCPLLAAGSEEGVAL